MRRDDIGVVILAAGASTRLGKLKQTVEFSGETLLDRSVRVAREACGGTIVVVLGAFAEQVRHGCKLQGCSVLQNPEWEDGLMSSIRYGISSLGRVAGAIVMTCDMPFVTSEHLEKLADRENLTASYYASAPGVPAYFPSSYFQSLTRLQGSGGAKALLGSADTIPLNKGELDIDTPEDLQTLKSLRTDR